VIAFLYATAWLLLASAELSAFLWDRAAASDAVAAEKDVASRRSMPG
jgi:hypothetical protein